MHVSPLFASVLEFFKISLSFAGVMFSSKPIFKSAVGAIKNFFVQGSIEEELETFVQKSAQGEAGSHHLFDVWRKVQYQEEASALLFDLGLERLHDVAATAHPKYSAEFFGMLVMLFEEDLERLELIAKEGKAVMRTLDQKDGDAAFAVFEHMMTARMYVKRQRNVLINDL